MRRPQFETKPPALNQKQQQQWQELNSTISKNGGAVISMPGNACIKFVCELLSELPERLRSCGYAVIPCGTDQRLWPVTETIEVENGRTITRQHVAPGVVGVWQLELPVS
jgi:hypothetical protein